jgi:hypothetical protein
MIRKCRTRSHTVPSDTGRSACNTRNDFFMEGLPVIAYNAITHLHPARTLFPAIATDVTEKTAWSIGSEGTLVCNDRQSRPRSRYPRARLE